MRGVGGIVLRVSFQGSVLLYGVGGNYLTVLMRIFMMILMFTTNCIFRPFLIIGVPSSNFCSAVFGFDL